MLCVLLPEGCWCFCPIDPVDDHDYAHIHTHHAAHAHAAAHAAHAHAAIHSAHTLAAAHAAHHAAHAAHHGAPARPRSRDPPRQDRRTSGSRDSRHKGRHHRTSGWGRYAAPVSLNTMALDLALDAAPGAASHAAPPAPPAPAVLVGCPRTAPPA